MDRHPVNTIDGDTSRTNLARRESQVAVRAGANRALDANYASTEMLCGDRRCLFFGGHGIYFCRLDRLGKSGAWELNCSRSRNSPIRRATSRLFLKPYS